MIISPNTPVIGASDINGVWIPGALFIGSKKQTVGIKPINLMAEELDERVIFTGPAHSYLAAGGKLKQSAENEWPLEYRNGVAVGRHEPEKAAKNYVPGVEYGSMAQSSGSATDWTYGAIQPSVVISDMGIATAVSSTTSVLTSVYSEAAGAFIAPEQNSGAPVDWTRIKRPFTSASLSLLRWYVARVTSTDWLMAKCPAVPAGQYVASVYRKVTANSLLSAGAQLEEGSIVTSPIISPTGQQASRQASAVTLKRDGNASAAVVHFSSNETLIIPFNDAESVVIPVSALDWGTRYITRIEYEA